MEVLTLYVIRNHEGKFFRRKGYGGEKWVARLTTARIYATIRAARVVISYFTKNCRQYVPELVALHVTDMQVLDETSRIERLTRQKEERNAAQLARHKLLQLQTAQEEFASAKARLDSLLGEKS